MMFGVAGVLEPVGRAPLRRTPLTRIVEPDTEVTVPVALANARRAADPPPDGARDGAPEGREEYEPRPPKPPPPPPAPDAGQVPLTLASMRTEVAVRALAEPAPGVPVTVTQSPAASWPVAMVVNLVAAVYTTVFCAVAD